MQKKYAPPAAKLCAKPVFIPLTGECLPQAVSLALRVQNGRLLSGERSLPFV